MDRRQGLSVRIKLTLSYVGFLMLAGTLLLAAVWMFLLRGRSNALFVPDLSDFRRAFDPGSFGAAVFVPAAVLVLGFLLVFGLVGGWILAGRVLAPLTRITEATRTAASGSLSQRIRLPGRRDEFRELADSFDTMRKWAPDGAARRRSSSRARCVLPNGHRRQRRAVVARPASRCPCDQDSSVRVEPLENMHG